MSSFGFLFLCIQACLIQHVFSLSLVNGANNYGVNNYISGLQREVDAASSGNDAVRGYGPNNYGYNAGLVGANLGLAGANYGLGGANYGLGGANYGLNGANIALGQPGLALGGNSGLVGSSFEGVGFVPDVSVSASLPVTGPYTGSGFGELAAGGDVAAYGTAVVTGQLPALGAIAFNGQIPASGSVSIAGNCVCSGFPL